MSFRSSRRPGRRGRAPARRRRPSRRARPARPPPPARRCPRPPRRRAAFVASALASGRPGGAGWLARTGIGHRGASARKVCTMLRCQPGIVSLRTAVKPLARSRFRNALAPSKSLHAAPQVAVQAGVAAAQPAHRDDDRRADRVPHRTSPAGSREPSTRAPPAFAPGRSSVRNARNWASGSVEVAQQVRGEDAVERPVDAGVGDVLDAAVHEPHRRRASAWRRPRPACPTTRRPRRSRRAGRRTAAPRWTRRCRSRRRAGAVRGRGREPACAEPTSRRWRWYPGFAPTRPS